MYRCIGMNVCMHLCIYESIYLSTHLPIYLSIHTPIHLNAPRIPPSQIGVTSLAVLGVSFGSVRGDI